MAVESHVYVLRAQTGATNIVCRLDDPPTDWTTINADRPEHSFDIWPYLGGGHMLHCVGSAAPWYSSDYGATWTEATPAVGTTTLTSFDIDPGGTRVWGTWDEDDTSPIAYSDDWGATWTVSSANIIPNSGIGSRPLVDISVNPTDPLKIVALGRTNLNKVGTMYTTNGGSTWATITTTAAVNSYLPGNGECITWLSDGSVIWSTTPGSGASGVGRAAIFPGVETSSVGYSAADIRQHLEVLEISGLVFCLFDAVDMGAALKRSTDYGVTWADVGLPSGWSGISGDDGSMEYDPPNDRLYISKSGGATRKVWYLTPTSTGGTSEWTDVTFDYGSIFTAGADFRGIIVTTDEGSEEPPTPGDDRGGWRYVVPPPRRIPWTAAPHAVVAGPSRRMPMR